MCWPEFGVLYKMFCCRVNESLMFSVIGIAMYKDYIEMLMNRNGLVFEIGEYEFFWGYFCCHACMRVTSS